MPKHRNPSRSAARMRRSTAFSEEHKEAIAEGRCGPIQGFACQPFLPLEEIRQETLKPEHLDELHSLARGCLEAVWHVRHHASTLVDSDDDRWWIQTSLVGGRLPRCGPRGFSMLDWRPKSYLPTQAAWQSPQRG